MANRNAGYGARRGGFWFYLSRAGANDSSGRVSKFTEKTRRKISFFDIAATRQINAASIIFHATARRHAVVPSILIIGAKLERCICPELQ